MRAVAFLLTVLMTFLPGTPLAWRRSRCRGYASTPLPATALDGP